MQPEADAHFEEVTVDHPLRSKLNHGAAEMAEIVSDCLRHPSSR